MQKLFPRISKFVAVIQKLLSIYTIEVRNNNVEKALRVLKKKLLKDGVMKELRDRQYYQKPSFKKREKKKESIRRHKKDQKIKALKGEL